MQTGWGVKKRTAEGDKSQKTESLDLGMWGENGDLKEKIVQVPAPMYVWLSV